MLDCLVYSMCEHHSKGSVQYNKGMDILGKRLYLQVGVAAKGIHNQVQQLVFGNDVLAEQRQALQEVLILLPVAHPLLHLYQTAAFEMPTSPALH